MSAKNRKRHVKKAKVCSFCGVGVDMKYAVLSPGVYLCSECALDFRAFLSEVGEIGEFGYATTDGRTGIFSVGTI